MAERTLYTPIIKGKANDFKAVGKMPGVLAARALPLVELLSPDDPDEMQQACDRFINQLRKHCPRQRLSVDLHAIPPDALGPGGDKLLEFVFAHLKGVGLNFVPVFGFDHEPELWSHVAEVAHRDNRGLTFRLTREDLEAPDDTRDDLIDRLRSARLDPQQVNLLVDLGSLYGLSRAEVAMIRSQAQDFIDLALTARPFGVVSVVGSSMPKDVTDVPKEGHAAVQRFELPLWLELTDSLAGTSVAFGDYGIVNPNFSVKAPATNANAKIRYTTAREHNIFRGYCLRDGEQYGQYHQLAHRVSNSEIYLGRDFSYGDDYIWRCAQREASCGNLGTWVEVDMNHHLVFAAAQLVRIESRVSQGIPLSEVDAILA